MYERARALKSHGHVLTSEHANMKYSFTVFFFLSLSPAKEVWDMLSLRNDNNLKKNLTLSRVISVRMFCTRGGSVGFAYYSIVLHSITLKFHILEQN